MVRPKPRESLVLCSVFLMYTAGSCKNCELIICVNKPCGHVISLYILCWCLNTIDFLEFTAITIKCSPLSSDIQIRNAVIYSHFCLLLYTSNIVVHLSRKSTYITVPSYSQLKTFIEHISLVAQQWLQPR